MDEKNFIFCDEEEEFVLTKLGFDKSPDYLREDGREVRKPLKGYEQAVPENWYVRGYVEKVDKKKC